VRIVLAGVCLLAVSSSASAQHSATSPSRVRAEAADVRALVAEAADRSPTVRALIDEVDRSDIIVYVRVRPFASHRLDGRTGFIGSRPAARFLMIEIACPRTRDAQIATLAHELQHVVEIAHAPWVVGPATLAEYYGRIGDHLEGDGTPLMFETKTAHEVGLRAARELVGRSTAAEPR
jgi:hypothetical protein